MLSRPVQDALVVLKAEFVSDSRLMGELAADAVFARAAAGELAGCVARLLELVTTNELGGRHTYEVFDLLAAGSWQGWDIPAVRSIACWADAWWKTGLAEFPGEQRAIDRLGDLAHLALPMGRWLSVWLEEFDGPGAQHLADFIVHGSSYSAWEGYEDQLQQAVSWTQSDSVVTGITMIAGVHFEPGQMASVLDRVIVTPGLV